jgi:hypothetical protein
MLFRILFYDWYAFPTCMKWIAFAIMCKWNSRLFPGRYSI